MRRCKIFAFALLLITTAGVAVFLLARRAAPSGNSSSVLPEATQPASDRRETVADSPSNQVQIITGFDYSPGYIDVKRVSGYNFELTFPEDDRRVGGWYMFKVEGAAGKTLSINMKNVPSKWKTHHPVYSYSCDLGSLKNFMSKKPRSTGGVQIPPSESVKKEKGKGKRKGKRMGPALPDTSLENWHYIADVTVSNSNLIVKHTFTEDHAYVAMRTPYTVEYNEALLEVVSKQPGVIVHDVGTSREGRPLKLVQIGGLTPSEAQNNPCIVVYAREDGYEHDTSWVAEGMMLSLLLKPAFKALPEKATFLIVPLLDPDGAVHSLYKNIGSSFLNNHASTPESIAWLGWFRDWVNQGNRLDVVINLHNVASRESRQIECALVEPKSGRHEQSKLLNKAIVDSLKQDQYKSKLPPWKFGYALDRMGGFLHSYFGNLHLAYEVNSQDSHGHLSLYRLRALGGTMAKAIVTHLYSPEAKPLLASIDLKRAKRQLLWDRYAKIRDRIMNSNNPFQAESSLAGLPAVERYYKEKGSIPGWLRPLYETGNAGQDNIP